MFSRSKAYANSCLTCGERKIPRNQTKAPMRPQPISNTPFGTVVIDYIGPITASFGRRYMLVMICEFTRYAVVVPTTCMDASVTARALMDHLILVYGCPNILKSDNGGSFVNSVIFELARILNIQLKRGQPWHPQAQATCERLNGTIMTILSMYARDEPRNWYLNVRYVVFTYNCQIHMSTKLSPYRLIFNKFPNIPIFVALKPKAEGVAGNAQDYLAEAALIAKENHEVCSRNTSKVQTANERRRQPGTKANLFVPGQLVWVYICSPPPKGISKKLVTKRYAGPYQVIKCSDSGVFYELANNENKKVPIKVHQNRMKIYIKRSMPPAVAPPPDDMYHADIPADYYPSTDKVPLIQTVETTDVTQPPLYEAEKIVDHSEDEQGNLTYQVKWKNFSRRNNTLVAAEVIKDDMLIQEYWNKQRISSISYS
jgi:hypothetical protein